MNAATFAELWTEIKTYAVAAIAELKADAVALETLIVPTVEQDLVTALDQLRTLAVDTILELAKDTLTPGAEKLSTVVTTVFQHAEANAIQVGIADVQMLAQQAYQIVATTLGEKQ